MFRRNDADHWVLYPFAADERLELASLAFSCPVAEIFAGIEEA